MARKRSEIQPMRPDVPIYPIGVAARLLNVHPRTLRIYEAEGLIMPTHVGSRRMFSANDIQWITCLRSFIHDEGISIPGLKKLLCYAPCWEIAGCPPETHEYCEARVDRAVPQTLHKVGDAAALREAKEEDQKKRRKVAQKKSVCHLAEQPAAGTSRRRMQHEATVIWLNCFRQQPHQAVEVTACG